MNRAVKLALAGLALLTSASLAEAATCQALLRQGGRIVDTYRMDFGGGDQLYVHIVRMPGGETTKCTASRDARRRR